MSLQEIFNKYPSQPDTVDRSLPITKDQANMLASVAHDGLALAVRPAHLSGDGDTMFALATGEIEASDHFNRVLAAGALSVSRAIVRGITMAKGLGGIPSVGELATT